MKILAAAIFKICLDAPGAHTMDAMQTCFDKYVNCTITMEAVNSDQTEKVALKRLNKCQYKTID